MKIIKANSYVNGKFIKSSNVYKCFSPFNGKSIGDASYIDEGHLEDVNDWIEMVTASKISLQPHECILLFNNLINYLENNRATFINTIIYETGKPIKYATIEFERGIQTIKDTIIALQSQSGQYRELNFSNNTQNKFLIRNRFAYGVVATITPFNFPFNLVIHKLIPAIAAGNCVIHKPSPKTPLTSYLLVHAMIEVGFPKDIVCLLFCEHDLLAKILDNNEIQVISFTGGTEVGWMLKRQYPLKKVLLECGGNASVIIDKKLSQTTINKLVLNSFGFAGQTCISLQRIYINSEIYENFLDLFINYAKKLKFGDPFDSNVDLSVLISHEALSQAEKLITNLKEINTVPVLGGVLKKNFLEPTVFTNVAHSSSLIQNELFLPIVSINQFDDFDDALNTVNDSKYGLQAGVFTDDFSNMIKAYKQLDFGAICINESATFRLDQLAYGGIKASGNTFEGPREAMKEMSYEKSLIIDYE